VTASVTRRRPPAMDSVVPSGALGAPPLWPMAEPVVPCELTLEPPRRVLRCLGETPFSDRGGLSPVWTGNRHADIKKLVSPRPAVEAEVPVQRNRGALLSGARYSW
jgi:hypothetical protein